VPVIKTAKRQAREIVQGFSGSSHIIMLKNRYKSMKGRPGKEPKLLNQGSNKNVLYDSKKRLGELRAKVQSKSRI
jgi:hypothetical protein